MSSGVSTKLVALLTAPNVALQTECLWCVLNLATGPAHIVKLLLQQGVTQALEQLLSSEDLELLDLGVWCIGNLAGDSVTTRDQILFVVKKLTGLLGRLPHEKWKNVIWALSNLCRGKPLPDREVTSEVLKIVPVVLTSTDEDILSDCCWALSYISDGDNQRIQDILDLNVLPRLISLLGHESSKVTIPSLRTLGNVVTGSDEQTQIVLNLGLVDKIAAYLSSKRVCLKREALWTLSNITAGSDEQINLVLTHPCFGMVVECLKDPDFEIKKEALWTISNATHAKTTSLVLKVIDSEAFPLLCDILEMKDSKILLVVLEAINNLLKAGNSAYSNDKDNRNNEVAVKFDEIGGLTKMENLQEHPNVKIYRKVVEIMEEHYGLIEVTDENNPPEPDMFSFN
jgi:importin subunit alpha-6/7